MQLPQHRTFFFFGEINTGHQQSSIANLAFEYKGQSPVHEPGIDRTNRYRNGSRKILQVHHL